MMLLANTVHQEDHCWEQRVRCGKLTFDTLSLLANFDIYFKVWQEVDRFGLYCGIGVMKNRWT